MRVKSKNKSGMGEEMRLDYADWLTRERVEAEERLWARDQKYRRYATAVNELVNLYGATTVEEIGCGTGWVPTAISPREYIGYDRNPHCLELARAKNQNRPWASFVDAEIRTLVPQHNDLVCAFAVLKHFSLDELPSLFQRLFGKAWFVAFTMPIANNDIEDGTEFTHSRWSEDTVLGITQSCGLLVIGLDTTDEEEPLFTAIRR